MSKSSPAVALIHVPDRFSVVEPGVYRSASPTASQVPFLASLQLRTIISLTPEFPVRQLIAFTRASGIDFLHYGTTLWRPTMDWKPITDDIVKATLETLLDKRYHPLLLMDPLGIHQTGCVIGALRMMQGWNFSSALVEYRSHSGQTKHRIADEQYIELFEPDLINLPPADFLPDWYQPIQSNEDLSDIWEGEGEGADWYEEADAGGAGEAGVAFREEVPDAGEGEKLNGDEKGFTGKEAGGRDSGGAGSGVG